MLAEEARDVARPLRGFLPHLRLLIVPCLVLVVWEIVAWRVGPVTAASPVSTVRAIGDGFRQGWLGSALGLTLYGAVIGFVISAVIGLALGFVLGLSSFWGEVIEAPLVWLYSIPKIVLFPIFLLFLGLTLKSRVAFSVAHGFIPLALFTMSGARAVRPVHLKVAKVYRLSRTQTILRIVVPTALPAIAVGLRYCFSLSFMGLLLGEMFASKEGSGYELILAIDLHLVPRMFAIAVSLVVIALVINFLLLAVEQAVSRRWQPGQ